MPSVLLINGFRFHFFSDEGNPREPVHVHIERAGDNAKFWLSPEVGLAYNYGFNARTLARLEKMVVEHRQLFEDAWNDHFSQS